MPLVQEVGGGGGLGADGIVETWERIQNSTGTNYAGIKLITFLIYFFIF